MFTVELQGEQAVIARFDAMPSKVHSALWRTLQALTLNLRDHVVNDKLQGQVLEHRTGKLSRSIDWNVADSGDNMVGAVFATGTAPYAHRLEYGWHGDETVKTFQRRQTMAFGKPIDPITVTVNSFTRKANQPARSFLRSSMKDQAAMIEKSLQDAVAKAAGATP